MTVNDQDEHNKYQPPPAQSRFDNPIREGGGSFAHLPDRDDDGKEVAPDE